MSGIKSKINTLLIDINKHDTKVFTSSEIDNINKIKKNYSDETNLIVLKPYHTFLTQLLKKIQNNTENKYFIEASKYIPDTSSDLERINEEKKDLVRKFNEEKQQWNNEKKSVIKCEIAKNELVRRLDEDKTQWNVEKKQIEQLLDTEKQSVINCNNEKNELDEEKKQWNEDKKQWNEENTKNTEEQKKLAINLANCKKNCDDNKSAGDTEKEQLTSRLTNEITDLKQKLETNNIKCDTNLKKNIKKLNDDSKYTIKQLEIQQNSSDETAYEKMVAIENLKLNIAKITAQMVELKKNADDYKNKAGQDCDSKITEYTKTIDDQKRNIDAYIKDKTFQDNNILNLNKEISVNTEKNTELLNKIEQNQVEMKKCIDSKEEEINKMVSYAKFKKENDKLASATKKINSIQNNTTELNKQIIKINEKNATLQEQIAEANKKVKNCKAQLQINKTNNEKINKENKQYQVELKQNQLKMKQNQLDIQKYQENIANVETKLVEKNNLLKNCEDEIKKITGELFSSESDRKDTYTIVDDLKKNSKDIIQRLYYEKKTLRDEIKKLTENNLLTKELHKQTLHMLEHYKYALKVRTLSEKDVESHNKCENIEHKTYVYKNRESMKLASQYKQDIISTMTSEFIKQIRHVSAITITKMNLGEYIIEIQNNNRNNPEITDESRENNSLFINYIDALKELSFLQPQLNAINSVIMDVMNLLEINRIDTILNTITTKSNEIPFVKYYILQMVVDFNISDRYAKIKLLNNSTTEKIKFKSVVDSSKFIPILLNNDLRNYSNLDNELNKILQINLDKLPIYVLTCDEIKIISNFHIYLLGAYLRSIYNDSVNNFKALYTTYIELINNKYFKHISNDFLDNHYFIELLKLVCTSDDDIKENFKKLYVSAEYFDNLNVKIIQTIILQIIKIKNGTKLNKNFHELDSIKSINNNLLTSIGSIDPSLKYYVDNTLLKQKINQYDERENNNKNLTTSYNTAKEDLDSVTQDKKRIIGERNEKGRLLATARDKLSNLQKADDEKRIISEAKRAETEAKRAETEAKRAETEAKRKENEADAKRIYQAHEAKRKENEVKIAEERKIRIATYTKERDDEIAKYTKQMNELKINSEKREKEKEEREREKEKERKKLDAFQKEIITVTEQRKKEKEFQDREK
jgi:hypothetical protein